MTSSAWLWVAVLLGACSSTTTIIPSGDGDGGAPDDDASASEDGGTASNDGSSATDASVVPLVCGAHKVTSAPIAIEKRSGTAPAATGGSLADGHYVASRFQNYGATSLGAKMAADLFVENGRFEWEEDNDAFGTFGASGTIKTVGSTLQLGHECKANNKVAVAFDYTTAGTTLTLNQPTNGGSTLVITLQKK